MNASDDSRANGTSNLSPIRSVIPTGRREAGSPKVRVWEHRGHESVTRPLFEKEPTVHGSQVEANIVAAELGLRWLEENAS